MVRSKITGGRAWGSSILKADLPDGMSKSEFLAIARKPEKTEEEKNLMQQTLANALNRQALSIEYEGKIKVDFRANTKALKRHRKKGIGKMKELEKRMANGEPLTDFQKKQVEAYRKTEWRRLKKKTHGTNAFVPVYLKDGQKLTKGISQKRIERLQDEYNIAQSREEQKQEIKLLKTSPRKAAAVMSMYGLSPYEDYVSSRVRKLPPTQKEVVSATARYMGVKPQTLAGVGPSWIERRKRSKQWAEIEKDIYNRREQAYLGTNASYRHWAKREGEFQEIDYRRLYQPSSFSKIDAQRYNELAEELGKSARLRRT